MVREEATPADLRRHWRRHLRHVTESDVHEAAVERAEIAVTAESSVHDVQQ